MIDSVSNASFAYFRFQGHPDSEKRGSDSVSEKDKGSEVESEKYEKTADAKKPENPNGKELTPEEKQQVEELKKRDAEVRAHEQAHLAAAGSLAMGGANYTFQTGPDGRPYAIGGDVKIDTSAGRTPQETIRKAQQIRAAALAPADPSPQDMKVAASAAAMETEAAAKLNGRNDRQSSAATGESEAANGEITSVHQIVSASESDSQQGYDQTKHQGTSNLAQFAASVYQKTANAR